MNKAKQFWTLLKFQTSINPFIIFMPLVLAMPFYITHLTGSIAHDYHPDLDLLLSNANLFFVGFIGVMWLAPEIFQFSAAQAMWSNGTEFLLTRAVDRHLLFRARVAFFYLLILIIPIAAFLAAWGSPVLQIDEYNRISHQQVLEKVPGSVAAPLDKHGKTQEIFIPHGNVLIEGWRLWVYLAAAIGTQILIFLIYPLKYRKYIFWTIYLGVLFIPLLGLGSSVRAAETGKELLSSNEILFFAYVTHQTLLWLLMAVALIAGQLWCERRFARLEQ